MYDLLLNENETMIVDTVREFLCDRLPLERLRPAATPVDNEARWREMAELGWFGVGLPETAGGSGLGVVEEMLIQRECGAHLVSPNLLATILAGHVALAAGDNEMATRFAVGETIASLAVVAPGDASSAHLLDWHKSDFILAWDETGMRLCDSSALAGPAREDCLDESVALSTSELALDKAVCFVPASDVPLELHAHVLLAAAQVGLAQAACDLAVDYAKIREQFGKPIGSFQAIKHRCADMAVRQRLAWYQTCLAALKLQAGAEDAALQCASALLLASEAARENGRACVQIHGGIGFQAECDAHWFVKRAFIYDLAGGTEQLQADRIMAAPEPAW